VEVVTGANGSGQLIGYRAINNSLNQFIARIALMIPAGGSSWVRVPTPGGFDQYVIPAAINEDGAIAGSGQNAAGVSRAFLSDNPSAVARDLGTLGGTNSAAFGLNNSQWVVGSADTVSAASAFLYDGAHMIDLNTTLVNGKGWHLSKALGINDYNDIVGVGVHDGQLRAFLLTPVKGLVQVLPCIVSIEGSDKPADQ